MHDVSFCSGDIMKPATQRQLRLDSAVPPCVGTMNTGDAYAKEEYGKFWVAAALLTID